jgi:hypothetical protein
MIFDHQSLAISQIISRCGHQKAIGQFHSMPINVSQK